jgi:hypothetical protein
MARLKISGPSFSTSTATVVERRAPSTVYQEEGVDPRSMKGMFRNDFVFQAIKDQLVAAFRNADLRARNARAGGYYAAVGSMGTPFVEFLDNASRLEDFELDFIMPEVEAMAEYYGRHTAEPLDPSLNVIKGVVYEYLTNPNGEPAAVHKVLGAARLTDLLSVNTEQANLEDQARRESVRDAEFEAQRIKRIHYARMAPEFEARREQKRLKREAYFAGRGR